MERWRGRVAVVTGASAGIGAAIAYQLQDAGVNVVGLARRSDKIPGAVEAARREAKERGHRPAAPAARAPGALHCVQCDVANEQDVVAAFKWVRDKLGAVHILVNNAGVGGPHSLAGASNSGSDEWKRILNVNVLGLSIGTREAVKLMKEKGVDDGHIVHIGSVAGHINPLGSGEQSMYFASKHAVRVLTEGLRKELVAAKSRIRVTEVSPGVVKTNFFDAMSIAPEVIAKQPHLLPEDVASAVLYAVAAPSHVQIHDVIIKPIGEPF
ncbi:hypothetical protein R5R35_009515 [Gryllus longicercus]|uniref:Short-chain dehydrogenase n=1 Tax=Gryllus longicercus TaxID=2509291 RepID=A0AAN9VU78_9ORTH